MTDKETMQLARISLDYANYALRLRAVNENGIIGEAIHALLEALARPDRRALTDAECARIVNNNSEEIEGCVYHSPYGIISDVEEFYGIKETE